MYRCDVRKLPLPRLLLMLLIGGLSTPALGHLVKPVYMMGDFETYDARTFFETTSIFGSSFSHDETQLLITSDASGIYNVYRQPVAGGRPVQLTHSKSDATFAVGYFPRDDRFLFMADQGGNELFHIYVSTPGIPGISGIPEGDATMDLTPGEKHRAVFACFNADIGAFHLLTNERDPRYMDLYRYDIETYERTMVFKNRGGFEVSDVSGNGRWVALIKVRNNADNELFLFDTKHPKREPKHLTPHQGDIAYEGANFSHDGATLNYLSNEDSEFNRHWSYDLESGDRTLVQAAAWDISFTSESKKGRYRVTGVNADARTEITVIDTVTGKALDLPHLPRGDITGLKISPSEQRMAFYVNGDSSPSNLFTLELDQTNPSPRQLTQSLNKAINQKHLVESKVVRYPSFDDLAIPALLYKPKLASAKHKVPAIVWVHGGPGGQSRHGYSANIQYLVNHGYAVLAVNNRGSSGYGKTFFHMDDLKHGDVDLKDCIHGRKYLESLDWIDGDRIGILGGSYGGYMVAAALAFEPEAFDVGVDIFGVTNWIRTLKSIPPWWEAYREGLYSELGDPEKEEERLRRISPLFHAQNIKRPLLVVQGANDPRVLKVESDELVKAARANGVPVEYLVFDDEGHGFSNKANRISAAKAYRDFLDRYLTGKPKY